MNAVYPAGNIFLCVLLILVACRPAPKVSPTAPDKSVEQPGGWIAFGVDFEGDFSFSPEGNAEIILLDIESARKDQPRQVRESHQSSGK